jgi:hypothetical protein
MGELQGVDDFVAVSIFMRSVEANHGRRGSFESSLYFYQG